MTSQQYADQLLASYQDKRLVVARYNSAGELRAIHMSIDDDWADRYKAALSNEIPPEGGSYLIWPEDLRNASPSPA